MGAKAAPTGAAIPWVTGHGVMCLEGVAFCEAVLLHSLTSKGSQCNVRLPPRLRGTAALSMAMAL